VAIGEGDGVSVGERAAAVKLPMTSASPRSAWDIGGAFGNTINLVLCAPAPTSLYSAATGSHQPYFGWTSPIRAREGFPLSHWTRRGERST
jgi:hypothetical protein